MSNLSAETFRTDVVARPRRLAFWNEVAASTFGDIAVDALESDFTAQLRRIRFGELILASVSSSPARVSGVRGGSGPAEGWFLLLNEQGMSRMSQGSREVCLRPGELTALRADDHYRIEFGRPNKTLVLSVPRKADDIDLEGHVARRHDAHDASLLIALMRQLEILDPSMEVSCADRLAVDIARLCWPAPSRTGGRRSMLAWEQRVRRHVEEHLSDPELDAASIARRFGVSTRFMHMVFARTGQSAAAFILERRLATVATNLRADPAARISHLALDAGFTDLSHFCRTFRRRFGVSARDYRRTR